MKKLMFFIPVVVICLNSCTEEKQDTISDKLVSEAVSTNKFYKILEKKESNAFNKLNLKIELKSKTTEDSLRMFANELKSGYPGFEKYWISYHLAGESGNIAWATTNFNPKLKIDINGSTAEEDKNSESAFNVDGDVIGKWRSEQALMGTALILYKKGKKVFLRTVTPKGTVSDSRVYVKNKNGTTIYDERNKFGEYYIVLSTGKLGMYDKDGIFEEAVIIK